MAHYLKVESLFDKGFVVYANKEEHLFEIAGIALFNYLTNTNNISDSLCCHVESTGKNKQELLVNFLKAIYKSFLDDCIIFGRFEVRFFNDGLGVEAWAYGEIVDHPILSRSIEVKNKIKKISIPEKGLFLDLVKAQPYVFSGEIQIAIE